MPSEGIEHKRVRKQVMAILARHGVRYQTDHGEESNGLRLFTDRKSKETHLSDADILIFNANGKVTNIIEIKDRDILPKNILGIIAATDLCNTHYDDDGNEHKFQSPFLHIVLNGDRINLNGCKKSQMELVNKNYGLGFRHLSGFKICLDTDFEKTFFNEQ